jgi:1-acyl-sn-glycerol-3-phosphate acyltransferase
MSSLVTLWHRFLHSLIRWVYFDRVRLVHRERLPDLKGGPILFVSLHRNGATDGFVLHGLFPRITFLISRQLRRGFFLRLFFCGIEAVRGKDEAGGKISRRDANREALDACHLRLQEGGQLAIFPEGTSWLGPRHLPFKSGAARILHRYLEENPEGPITVVPLGLYYERAWAFRRRVEVLVGPSVDTALSPELSTGQRLCELKQRLHDALEGVGAEFRSEKAQERGETLAYASTLRTSLSYAEMSGRFADHLPHRITETWRTLDVNARALSLWRHQGVPLFPLSRTHLALYLLLLLLLAPLVIGAAAMNLPVLFPSWWMARRKADGVNVISLIRIMVGFTLAPFWITAVAVGCALWAGPWFFLSYLTISVLGLLATYRFQKLAVTVRNGLFAPQFRARALQFRNLLLDQYCYENYSESSSLGPTPVR